MNELERQARTRGSGAPHVAKEGQTHGRAAGMDPSWSNITDPIFHWAAERPDRPAIYVGHHTLTYGELAPLVAKAAVHLGELGIVGQRPRRHQPHQSMITYPGFGPVVRLRATTMELRFDGNPPSAELLGNLPWTIFFRPP